MDEFDELIESMPAKPKGKRPKANSRRQGSGSQAPAPMRDAAARTPLAPDAPAPRLQAMVDTRGQELTANALSAWNQRIAGTPIVDIAYGLDISIVLAKQLIKEVHEAIREDLKESLDINRQLDLERIDGLINSFYPPAREGDPDSAAVVLRAMQHRAKLVGLEPLPDPGRSQPANVLVWIQNQLPSINKIVDSLPLELPPGAPGS